MNKVINICAGYVTAEGMDISAMRSDVKDVTKEFRTMDETFNGEKKSYKLVEVNVGRDDVGRPFVRMNIDRAEYLDEKQREMIMKLFDSIAEDIDEVLHMNEDA